MFAGSPIQAQRVASHQSMFGSPQARNDAVDAVKYWGRVCFVGEGNTTTFDISPQIIHKQITIHGSWTFSTGGLAEVADYVVERNVPLDDLITHSFRLDQAELEKMIQAG